MGAFRGLPHGVAADEAIAELYAAHWTGLVRLAWLLLRDDLAAGDAVNAARAFVDSLGGIGAWDRRTPEQRQVLLDNIANIKAYWIMMGLPLAQVALHFGANDVQGTVVREQIFHAAGARTETEQKVPELVRFVRDAGRIPVQRDTLYGEVRRWDD